MELLEDQPDNYDYISKIKRIENGEIEKENIKDN